MSFFGTALKILSALLISASLDSGYVIKIKKNKELVIPGKGAENAVINEHTDSLINVKGVPEKKSEFNKIKEIFKDVFNTKSHSNIYFDTIFYYKSQKAIVFIHNNIITAVAGLSDNRVTIDSINLRRGIDYFIFNYGNNNLEIIKKGNDKINNVYIYSTLGIAVFDDNSDDKIDLYLIFAPQ